jgi:hypothetical protein
MYGIRFYNSILHQPLCFHSHPTAVKVAMKDWLAGSGLWLVLMVLALCGLTTAQVRTTADIYCVSCAFNIELLSTHPYLSFPSDFLSQDGGYYSPTDNTIDTPAFAWRTFPTGASSMSHRPWVQPRVPTGPIVIPATSSIGPQYAGVLLPQPILPFAANYVSLPLRTGHQAGRSGFADYTNHLTPPIFLETDAKVSAASAGSKHRRGRSPQPARTMRESQSAQRVGVGMRTAMYEGVREAFLPAEVVAAVAPLL